MKRKEKKIELSRKKHREDYNLLPKTIAGENIHFIEEEAQDKFKSGAQMKTSPYQTYQSLSELLGFYLLAAVPASAIPGSVYGTW